MSDLLVPAFRVYLLVHRRPPVIAAEAHCHSTTVRSIIEKLFMYSSPFRLKGAPRKIFPAAEDSLISCLEHKLCAMQKEMIRLLQDWVIRVFN